MRFTSAADLFFTECLYKHKFIKNGQKYVSKDNVLTFVKMKVYNVK